MAALFLRCQGQRLASLNHAGDVLWVKLAAHLGLGAFGPAVELAAGENHLVDLVATVDGSPILKIR